MSTATNAIQTIDRNLTRRDEFGASQAQLSAETAVSAASAREEAIIKAEYVMAERHPRKWPDIRVQMLDHCSRPRFADVARYAKPVGKKKVNGEWIEEIARGFSARFMEVLCQEMGNLKPFSRVTYEDDLIRIVMIGVVDLQKNITRSREVSFAKRVEKRGFKRRGSDEWEPPAGRQVISMRLNTENEPTYLVVATEDEMRNKVNSEESKTQRDFIQRLCPRDILEECEERILETMAKEDKSDPQKTLNRIIDRFHEFAIMPSDLEQYMGKPVAKFNPADLQALRDLGAAIRDGQTTFDEALKAKYDQPTAMADERDAIVDQKLTTAAADKHATSTPTKGSGEAHQTQAHETPSQAAPEIPTYTGDWPDNPPQDRPAPAAPTTSRPKPVFGKPRNQQ